MKIRGIYLLITVDRVFNCFASQRKVKKVSGNSIKEQTHFITIVVIVLVAGKHLLKKKQHTSQCLNLFITGLGICPGLNWISIFSCLYMALDFYFTLFNFAFSFI